LQRLVDQNIIRLGKAERGRAFFTCQGTGGETTVRRQKKEKNFPGARRVQCYMKVDVGGKVKKGVLG